MPAVECCTRHPSACRQNSRFVYAHNHGYSARFTAVDNPLLGSLVLRLLCWRSGCSTELGSPV